MIQKYDEFINDEIQLNESEEKMVNEAAEIIAEKIKNGESVDEGLFGSVVGGLTGAAIYDLLNSRMFTTAVAAYIGYKN